MRIRGTELSWQELDDEVVVLDLRGGIYLKLNRTAASLWKELAAGAEPSDLRRGLVQVYGLSPEDAEADVTAFLAQLEGAGLLDQ